LNGEPQDQTDWRARETVTWIWLDPETGGQFKVEFYDFSETAPRMFGNDIAYTTTIHEMDKLYSAAKQDETSIIPWIAECCKSYFGIKQWLEQNEIDHDIERESWA
jgi:hypothetical protein